MSRYKENYDNIKRDQPFFRTVSSLKGVTNNLRMFADNLDQLLNSLENFAPQIEMVAKGSSKIVSALAPKNPVRPSAKKGMVKDNKSPEKMEVPDGMAEEIKEEGDKEEME